MENTLSYLDSNVRQVRENISKAAKKSGRDENDVNLMAAVKYGSVEEINYIHKELGINDIGENRVQQLLERWDKLDREGLRVHFIGSLQKNKVKYIIDKVSLIHSLDSEGLAIEIDKQAKKQGIVMDVLLEINSGNEESKGGIAPEEVEAFCEIIQKYENIRIRGFMTMAPKCINKEDYHKYFGNTRELCENLWKNILHREDKMILSMGMSESYEIAIEEGSTIVRVGSKIFFPKE